MADHCTQGCTGACHQGRLPCPRRPADVAAMREMGVDLRPLPEPEPDTMPRAVALRILALILIAAGIGLAAGLWR